MSPRRWAAVVVAALMSFVVGASPAAASAPWIVIPGGPAVGTSGQLLLTNRPASGGDDLVWTCGSSQIDFNFFSSPDSQVADLTDVMFTECVFGGLISFEFDTHTPWQMHALSYSDPVVGGEIRGVSATVISAGCLATIEGFTRFTYDNVTDELTVLPDFTLEFTYVDPVDNCLGLFNVGDTMAVSAVYQLSEQDILPAAEER